jgi:hypothetical protein
LTPWALTDAQPPGTVVTMQSKHGSMSTGRPERYAKQLAGHWARKTEQADENGATTLRFENGNTVLLRPGAAVLEVEVTVPDGGDVDAFAQVVAEHLQRFGQRDELDVTWS